MKTLFLFILFFSCLITFSQDVHKDTCFVRLPESFTPNGDGLNDTLGVLFNCPITKFNIAIFNRWGVKVFESTSIKSNGGLDWSPVELESGVYVYSLKCSQLVNETWIDRKISSHVTLIK